MVYTSPEALTFVREPVVVDRYEDDAALLGEEVQARDRGGVGRRRRVDRLRAGDLTGDMLSSRGGRGDDALDRRLEPEVPLHRGRLGRGTHVLRRSAAPRNAGGRVPRVRPAEGEIQTLALGLSATEIENLVTVPLEQALNGVPDLDTIRSNRSSSSQIELIFGQGTDLLTARQLVAERIAAVSPTLPRWAAPRS